MPVCQLRQIDDCQYGGGLTCLAALTEEFSVEANEGVINPVITRRNIAVMHARIIFSYI